jgi:hypothetical protein
MLWKLLTSSLLSCSTELTGFIYSEYAKTVLLFWSKGLNGPKFVQSDEPIVSRQARLASTSKRGNIAICKRFTPLLFAVLPGIQPTETSSEIVECCLFRTANPLDICAAAN